jgi:hypothetical protein
MGVVNMPMNSNLGDHRHGSTSRTAFWVCARRIYQCTALAKARLGRRSLYSPAQLCRVHPWGYLHKLQKEIRFVLFIYKCSQKGNAPGNFLKFHIFRIDGSVVQSKLMPP